MNLIPGQPAPTAPSLRFFLSTLLLTCIFSIVSGSARGQSGQLQIDVVHPPDRTADVRVALYTNPDNWLEEPVHTAIEVATDTLTSVTFPGLPPGIYGAAVYLDENRNGELDRNLVGWFKEPFGFSKEARARFGPPRWEDAVFTVPESGTAQLTIRID